MRTRVVVVPYEKIEGKPEEEAFKIIAEAIRRKEAERLKYIGREVTI